MPHDDIHYNQSDHVPNKREIETSNLGFMQMASQRGVGVKLFCLSWHLCAFLEQPLVSVSLYYEPFSGWWRLCGRGKQHQTAPNWKCMSGIGDNRFTCLMDLLTNYTFYTNLTILSIGYLFIQDVTSLITFNLWKVEKSLQDRLMPI